jgi:iron complex transport system substrate-binding protein
MRKEIVLLLVLVTIFATLGAAGSKEITGTDFGTTTIVDIRGREVAVPNKINSIIALDAGSLRMISYFDAIDKIIAVEDSGHGGEKTFNQFFPLATYRLAHPHLRTLPDIGGKENIEGIIAANPDIIFSTTVDVNQLNQMQASFGIPVFAINADVELNDLKLTYDQLELVGKVLKEESRSKQLIEGIQFFLDDLEKRTKDIKETKRAYAGGMMYYGPADLLRTTGDYDSFDLVNVTNVMPPNPTGNKQPYLTSIEDLIKENPQFIFIDLANENLSLAGYKEHKNLLDNEVSAFKNRNVYTTLVYKYYGTNWESPIINAYFVGKIVYPNNFADVKLEDVATDVWRLFFQKELDYNEIVELQGSALKQAQWF